MPKQKQFTLSDSDFDRLSEVAESCGLTLSQVLSQYIRRYSNNLEQLLTTSNNLEQPRQTSGKLEQPKHSEVVPKLIEIVPIVESTPTVPMSTPPVLAVIESPEDELSRLRSLKPMEKMKHSTRIEQLKTQLGT